MPGILSILRHNVCYRILSRSTWDHSQDLGLTAYQCTSLRTSIRGKVDIIPDQSVLSPPLEPPRLTGESDTTPKVVPKTFQVVHGQDNVPFQRWIGRPVKHSIELQHQRCSCHRRRGSSAVDHNGGCEIHRHWTRETGTGAGLWRAWNIFLNMKNLCSLVDPNNQDDVDSASRVLNPLPGITAKPGQTLGHASFDDQAGKVILLTSDVNISPCRVAFFT